MLPNYHFSFNNAPIIQTYRVATFRGIFQDPHIRRTMCSVVLVVLRDGWSNTEFIVFVQFIKARGKVGDSLGFLTKAFASSKNLPARQQGMAEQRQPTWIYHSPNQFLTKLPARISPQPGDPDYFVRPPLIDLSGRIAPSIRDKSLCMTRTFTDVYKFSHCVKVRSHRDDPDEDTILTSFRIAKITLNYIKIIGNSQQD